MASTRHADLDRAITDAASVGFTTLVADPRGRLVGATAVGRGAAETLAEVVAWMSTGARLTDVASAPHAYPTRGEAIGEAALGHLRGVLGSRRVRAAVRPVLAARRLLA